MKNEAEYLKPNEERVEIIYATAYGKVTLPPSVEDAIKAQAKTAVEQQVALLKSHLEGPPTADIRALCSASVPSTLMLAAAAGYLTSIGYLAESIGVPLALLFIALSLAFLRGWWHARTSRL